MKVIPVFLFGTRGDVLPVVTVIDRYLESLRPASNLWRCVVVTHACFAADLQHIGSDFEVRSVPGPPIDQDEKSSTPDYASDFMRSLGPEDSVVCVLSNMFSLQSVFVAFQTGAMCVLLHPCRPIVRSAVKRDLLGEFEALQPELYRRCGPHADYRGLQHVDYEHWLWPTLADEFDESTIRSSGTLPGPVVLILCSPRLCEPLPAHQRYYLCGAIPCGAIGENVYLDAVLSSASPDPQHTDVYTAPVASNTTEAVEWLHDTCHSSAEPLRLCVDFGSMLPLLTSDARLPALVDALCAISTPTRCVFVCHGLARSIAAQVANTLRAGAQVKVLLVEHSVDHSALLPSCTAVLHHGGIGTTHACMRAGVPQSKSVVRGYGLRVR
jgi:hypothetical protein